MSFGSALLSRIQSGASHLTQTVFGPGQNDLVHDGERVALNPTGASGDAVLYVNGAATDAQHARAEASDFARTTHRSVLLIDNATGIRQYKNPLAQTLSTIGGSRKDGEQILADHQARGDDPAVVSMKDEIMHRLRAARGVEIAGYSQGAGIAARALNEAKDARLAELTPSLGSAGAEAEVKAELARVHVLNISGTAKASDFPEGIDYHHVENAGDPVVRELGEGSGPRRDAEFEQRLNRLAIELPLGLEAHRQSNVLALNGAAVDALF
ncbi:MAG: hypothetical protein U1E65_03070 [Myxococcota bacterium]